MRAGTLLRIEKDNQGGEQAAELEARRRETRTKRRYACLQAVYTVDRTRGYALQQGRSEP